MSDIPKTPLEEFIDSSRNLPQLPRETATNYRQASDLMTRLVNEKLTRRTDLATLIGTTDPTVMLQNHEHHVAFMANVFLLNRYPLLARTMIWVYRTYLAHGFSLLYWPAQLEAWVEAVETYLPENEQGQITQVYQWMMESHEKIITILEQGADDIPSAGPQEGLPAQFMNALLNADHRQALKLAEQVDSRESLEKFLVDVIQPCMYQIGALWEQGKVSVAHEHLASSIASRVMSQLYLHIDPTLSDHPSLRKAIITASPNEYHELGAWMISDLLELDGWEVQYLGANTPQEDLLDLLLSFHPQLLAISASMVFNLDKVQNIIDTIRITPELKDLKVMVGGAAFSTSPELWRDFGADATAGDAREAIRVAKTLVG